MQLIILINNARSYLKDHRQGKTVDVALHLLKTGLLSPSIELKNLKLGMTEKFSVKKGISIKGANASKEMMLADFGLSLGPRFLVQSKLQNGPLIEVLSDWQTEAPRMYFMLVDNKVKNPLISYFTDFTDFTVQRLRDALATS
ncbi:hypothetical protein CXF72_00205 [Psychromonas sp. MB-3u-54]|uniref:hypothetical protein n=1 Tax=Psychromonas sp. MB-3u-54 TaxID=2058319 RepID=UPI000C33A4C9|nr:hypothetical protein [Psychromonas sp. MB-3u-54]PKH04564.1 hypothetical protein CXF72_00205 [Psychromonas sp. MB-3u-54]